jgi:Ca2+-binding EF-hand superfamily protein
MLSLNTERRLARFFSLLAECERIVEQNRQNLCMIPSFDLYSVFQLLDVRNAGRLDLTDLKSFLSRNCLSVLRASLLLLIQQYDSNFDGKLGLEEFQALVLSSEDQVLRQNVLSRSVFPVNQRVENALARHLELEADWLSRVNQFKRKLVQQPDFSPIDAFRILDFNRTNLVGVLELKDFMKKHGVKISEIEADRIIRRIDLDADAKISYDEFVTMLKSWTEEGSEKKGRKKKKEVNRSLRTSPSKSPTRSPSRKMRKSAGNGFGVSSFSDSTRAVLQVFISQICLENEVESARIDLFRCFDFNLFDLFHIFDLDNKQFVTVADIENVLRDLRVPYNIDEIYLLVKHYSVNKELVMRVDDFERIWVPRDEYAAHRLRSRQGRGLVGYNRASVFRPDTLDMVARVLRVLLQNEIEAERIRKSVAERHWVNLYEAFGEIDASRDAGIDFEELGNAFRRIGEQVSARDVKGLMERYDRDFDGKISYVLGLIKLIRDANGIKQDISFVCCNISSLIFLLLFRLNYYIVCLSLTIVSCLLLMFMLKASQLHSLIHTTFTLSLHTYAYTSS